ncbi:hypothetical protein PMAYCL1PPCAC_28272, partial [Pristionchus mayeri]
SCSLYVKNLDSSVRKFVMTTMEVKEKERYVSACPVFTTTGPTRMERFVLCGQSEAVGCRRIFPMKDAYGIHRVQISVAIQRIDPAYIDGESATVVVVKDREFRVSAPYLSMWSRYFRVYFQVDMKEKKEGRYPIKDENISPDDFQELLNVINPTDKPITSHNYMKLLEMANRFEMPELTRRVELFLIDFERNDLSRATAFRVASDLFNLQLVQSSLLHRWRDPRKLQNELLTTGEYAKLSAETKALVNER